MGGGRGGWRHKKFKKLKAAFEALGIIHARAKPFPTGTSHAQQSAYGMADTTANIPAHVPYLDRR